MILHNTIKGFIDQVEGFVHFEGERIVFFSLNRIDNNIQSNLIRINQLSIAYQNFGYFYYWLFAHTSIGALVSSYDTLC